MRYQNLIALLLMMLSCWASHAQPKAEETKTGQRLFIDVHYLPEGKVKYKDVAEAHLKDLAVEERFGVQFLKYWVDESKGIVYCLSSAHDTAAIRNTHREAHGLLPQQILEVKDGIPAGAKNDKDYYLDVHRLGAGKVTAADVEKAHQKDLAVQDKYGVRFINYWVDEKSGTILCLSQATDSSNVIQTHKEAHGLLPETIEKVKQGQ